MGNKAFVLCHIIETVLQRFLLTIYTSGQGTRVRGILRREKGELENSFPQKQNDEGEYDRGEIL